MSSQEKKEKSNNTGNSPFGTTIFIKLCWYWINEPRFSDLMNKYKQAQKERKAKNTSFLTPSKKCIIVEEFKDELKSFKSILNETKKT